MKRFKDFINENISNIKEENICLLFTDIVKSSSLWSTSEKKMLDALSEHFKRLDKIASKHKGIIIKTIGDAFMVSFEDPLSALNSSIEIQEDLKNNPIKISNKNLEIRVGFAYGEVYKTTLKIQNKQMNDFFGNTVNTASRMESKVCDPNEIAFTLLATPKNEDKIKEIINNRCETKVIKYSDKCDKQVKRSGRLLTDQQRYSCKPISDLKGVKDLIAYKCKIVH